MWASMMFQLLTPAISLTFVVCFLTIYFYDKSKKAPLILAIGYACGAASLILDYFRLNFDPAFAAIVTNTLYTATLFLTTLSIAVHNRTKAPMLLMSAIAAIQALFLLYFIYVVPDITIRTIIANTSAASLLACALLIIPIEDRKFIDRLIFWVVAATSIQFYLRAIFVAYMGYYQGLILTDANYSQSIIVISLHFSIAIFSLILAVTSCIAFGMDAISDVQKIADTDPVSGLSNKRSFELLVKEKIETAKKKKLPLSLIIADLDKFKVINDTYGSSVGDEILYEFGKLLNETKRDGDIVGRLREDKFCILLHTSDLNLGKLFAESIRQSFASKAFTAMNKNFSLTASFGVAELEQKDTYGVFLVKAENQLYNAKQSGRNQVRPKRMNYILKSII